MPSLQFEAGYEAGYRDGIGIVSPWAQILIALGGLRDQMPVDEVIAVQRFAERLKDRRRDSDGTATAAVCEDIPVPKGLPSAGPKDIAQHPNEYPHP